MNLPESTLANEATLAHFETVAQALHLLVEQRGQPPSLAQLAHTFALSETHFQKIFCSLVGISPKRFLQFLNKEYARSLLVAARDTLHTAYESGLSGGGRLHDLMIHCEAVTPGEIRQRGGTLEICYGLADTPFGRALFGMTARGLCHLHFIDGADALPLALADLRHRWPKACLREAPEDAARTAEHVFCSRPPGPLHLWVQGTNFQIRVWQALLAIPPGQLTTYGELATALGCVGGARAIGNAVGANPVACLIPCHRVIRESGALGGYRWGLARKIRLLAHEFPEQNNAPPTSPTQAA